MNIKILALLKFLLSTLSDHHPLGIWEFKSWRNEATKFNSQSLKSRTYLTSQLFISPMVCITNKDSTKAFPLVEFSYDTGQTTLRVVHQTNNCAKNESSTILFIKQNVLQEFFPYHPNTLPQTTPMSTLCRFRGPTTPILSKLLS